MCSALGSMAATVEQLEELRLKLVKYEDQQNQILVELRGQVASEVGSVTGGLKDLHERTRIAVEVLTQRVDQIEVGGAEQDKSGGKWTKSLMSSKHMIPNKLKSQDEWKGWKADVEDYCEETFLGMKKWLDEIKTADEEVTEEMLPGDWWSRGAMLWRFLKKYTEGDGKKIIAGVRGDNGWEAWRKLHQEFEPAAVMREAMVLSQYTGMVAKRAKNPEETRTLMIELAERARRVEEVTGTEVDDKHAMSVIAGILDPETLRHTAQYQGARASVETLKRKVMEFVNLVGSSGKGVAAMELGRVQSKMEEDIEGLQCTTCFGQEEYYDDAQGEGGEEEQWNTLNAFEGQCHNCNGFGHRAAECPSKGGKSKGKGKGDYKGKGKGYGGKNTNSYGKGYGKSNPQNHWSSYGKYGPIKGGSKRKGKGKGPRDGCFICGGNHYQADCTQNQNRNTEGIRSLCNLKIAEKTSSTKEEDEDGGEASAKEAKGKDEHTLKKEKETLKKKSEVEKEKVLKKNGFEERKSGIKEADNEGFQTVKSKRAMKRERHNQNKGNKESINMLMTINPPTVNRVTETPEWEEIEMAVDSGATETVVGIDMLESIETSEGEAARKGVEYEVASGQTIPNLGEKQFVAVGEEGCMRKMKAQVCDVNKPLLSVNRMVQAGNRVVFENGNNYVEDLSSGERMYLTEKGGMYMLKLWVKNPFHRPAQ